MRAARAASTSGRAAPPRGPPRRGGTLRRDRRGVPRVAARPKALGGDALGGQDFIYSQRSGVSETLYKGDVLGVDADVATGDMRATELRAFANVLGAYHVPERFRDRFALHVAKHALAQSGAIPPDAAPPLILGIWGAKGCGKSFNLELCCRDLGVVPIVTSAGELEDPVAGEPGALLRRRYLAAAEASRHENSPAILIVNDLDAGVGRFKDDKLTVNNQIVQATLMNLCDDPTRVSVGAEWRDDDRATCARVPIVVTGNDASRIYAPLRREGRMDCWHWEPTREETARIVDGLFRSEDDARESGSESGPRAEDSATGYGGFEDAVKLVSAFPNQPMDFFGSIRSRCADDAVRAWLAGMSAETMRDALVGERRAASGPSALPFAAQDLSLPALLRAGAEIAREQQRVVDINLAREYVAAWTDEPSAAERRARRDAERRRVDGKGGREEEAGPERAATLRRAELEREARFAPEAVKAAEAARAAARDAPRGESVEIGVSFEEERAEAARLEATARDEAALPWRVASAIECFRMLKKKAGPGDEDAAAGKKTLLLDARPRKEHDREAIAGAASCPAATLAGTVSAPEVRPDVDAMRRALRDVPNIADAATVIVVADGGGEGSWSRDALFAIRDEIRADAEVVEMRGGMRGWLEYYTPSGAPRPRYVGYGSDNEETFWTSSN